MDETTYPFHTNVFLDKIHYVLPIRISFHDIAQIFKCQKFRKVVHINTKRFKLSCLVIDANMLFMFVSPRLLKAHDNRLLGMNNKKSEKSQNATFCRRNIFTIVCDD